MDNINPKWFIYGAIFLGVIIYSNSGSSSGESQQGEEVMLPTQGLITTLQETSKDLFKISDETEIDKKEESLVIANYMDSTSDTFTLEQIKLYYANGGEGSPRLSGLATAASFGFMGYMMGRSMRSPVRAGAYMDQKTFNKVNNNAGSSIRRTATRTTKPSSGKSGYGGSKSTRSYGG